jgi:putative membrane protein
MGTNASHLTDAIAAAERETAAELVVVVAPRVTTSPVAAALLSMVATQAALAFMIFADVDFDPLHVGPIVAIAAGLAFLLGLRGLPVRLVTTAAQRQRAIDDAALAAFTRAGVYRTSRRVGLLVFVAEAEREARVLLDQGLIDVVPRDVRDGLRGTLQAPVAAADKAGVAAVIASWGGQLAPYLPRTATDANELDDVPLAADAVAAVLDRAP